MSAPGMDKIALYEAMVQSDPGNTLIKLNLYDLCHRAGQLERAASGFSELIDDGAYGRVARSQLAKVRLSQQRFDEAKSLIRALIDDGNRDAALYHNLGIALYHEGDWQEAEKAFLAALEGGLASGDNLRYLAFSLHQQKKPDQAKAIVQRWLEAGPTDEGIGYLSLLELELGNREAAQQAADQALGLNPENLDAQWVKSVDLMERQDMERAERLLLRILDKQPQSYRALHGLGMVSYYGREFDKAIGFLERALAVSPKQLGSLLTLGWAHIAKHDVQSAEKTFRHAIAVEQNFAESHGGLATCLALQRRVDEAQRAITVARRLDKRSFGAAYAQSIVTALQGEQDKATKLLEVALRQPLGAGAPSIEESLKLYFEKQGIVPTPAETASGPAGNEAVDRDRDAGR